MDFSPLIPWLLLLPLPPTLPHLTDLILFPPQKYAEHGFAVADAHHDYCERHWRANRDERMAETWWRSRCIEARAGMCTWGRLRAATDVSNTAAGRREALADLRERLGPEAYYAGRMAPPLPPWRIPLRPEPVIVAGVK